MTSRFTVVPASYVYLMRESASTPGRTEVLLQLRGKTGYRDGHWAAAAAGHVERGETAVEAARRELREELGISTDALHFEFTMHRTAHDLPIDERVDFFFTTRSWTGEPAILEPEKALELRWCPVEELPKPMVPHEAYAISRLGTDEGYLSFGF